MNLLLFIYLLYLSDKWDRFFLEKLLCAWVWQGWVYFSFNEDTDNPLISQWINCVVKHRKRIEKPWTRPLAGESQENAWSVALGLEVDHSPAQGAAARFAGFCC